MRAVTAESRSPALSALRPDEVQAEVAVAELEPGLVVAELRAVSIAFHVSRRRPQPRCSS